MLDAALATFLNELAASSTRHVLILDDYHVLTDPRIHESVEFFLAYAAPALHLVVAGRSDPPLPLARLRARGELSEIRADDFRFRADEARALFDAIGGITPDDAPPQSSSIGPKGGSPGCSSPRSSSGRPPTRAASARDERR